MVDYDPHDWNSHLLDIHGSMIREIFARVLTCVLWALAVTLVHEWYFLPYGRSLGIPESGHALIGVALGLLLVFRTNASYDRFWEGRKQWGSIVNECRNLARAASVYLAANPALARRLITWTSAFAWSTMHRLRGKCDLGRIAEELPADDVREVLAETHGPLAVARRMTGLIVEARHKGIVSDYVQVTLDQNVQLLVDYMGACERIHNTPMPFAYMVHLRRALILYCFTLPFALVDHFGWGTWMAVLLIAYVLYGVEEIGVEIEDPFGEDENDLPLERICGTIEDNLRGIAETLEPADAVAAI
ncbi:MAG: bestrophin family protein [Planctomycetaceae bacterium]